MKLIGASIVRDELDPWFPLMLKQTLQFVDELVLIVSEPSKEVYDAIYSCRSHKIHIVHNRYDHNSKEADGRQRTIYLDYLKNHFVGDWAIVVDTDEILSDDAYLFRSVMKNEQGIEVFSPRMHHFFWNLGLEDGTREKHYVPNRFFKITEKLNYPQVEHPVLLGGVTLPNNALEKPSFFHYGGTQGLTTELKKLKVQLKKSNMHSKGDLKQWRDWHINGKLPVRSFPIDLHPLIVKKHFLMNDEVFE